MKGSEVAKLARGDRTYREMAKESGLSKSEIHVLEHSNSSPTVLTVQKICRCAANGITMSDFFKASYD